MPSTEFASPLQGFVIAGYAADEKETDFVLLIPVLSSSADAAIDAVRASRPGFLFSGLLTETMIADCQQKLAAQRADAPASNAKGFIVAGTVMAADQSEQGLLVPILSTASESAVETVATANPGFKFAGVLPEELLLQQIESLATLRRQGAISH
jgi:hypothetical protein